MHSDGLRSGVHARPVATSPGPSLGGHSDGDGCADSGEAVVVSIKSHAVDQQRFDKIVEIASKMYSKKKEYQFLPPGAKTQEQGFREDVDEGVAEDDSWWLPHSHFVCLGHFIIEHIVGALQMTANSPGVAPSVHPRRGAHP